MSHQQELNKRDLIEAAMSRALVDTRKPDSIFVEGRTLAFRREQDQALKRRLGQLEAAQSCHAPPITSPLVSSDKGQVTSTHRRFSGWISPLPGTAFVALLCGAGVMWLAMGGLTTKSGHLAAASPVPAIQSGSLVSAPALLSVNPSKSVADAVLVRAAGEVDNSGAEVRDLVEGWRQAWEQRDVDVYLGYYGWQFAPANGQTRLAWSKARQQNLSSRSSIKVGIKDIRVERLDADKIKVSFLQDYASGTYQESARPKSLLFVRTGKKWQISGEWQDE